MKKPTAREQAEKQVLDLLERLGKGMSWESEIELYENIVEFCEEHLKELKRENHTGD